MVYFVLQKAKKILETSASAILTCYIISVLIWLLIHKRTGTQKWVNEMVIETER